MGPPVGEISDWLGSWADGTLLGGRVRSTPPSSARLVSFLLLLQLAGCSSRGRGRNSEGPVGLEKGESLPKGGDSIGNTGQLRVRLGVEIGPLSP